MAAQDLVKATSSLTKASQCRDDTAILAKAHANWEEYLTPAPMSIAFLGELVFISSKQDFSIKAGGPIGGFKFLKYPDSFRACLLQVCNSGWTAFNEAHKNMDQIRLHTLNVPSYIKTAVSILIQNDDNLVQNLLPDTLDSINNISASCVVLAESVEKKFAYVTDLISEFLETCTSAKQSYGKEVEEIRKMVEYQKMKAQFSSASEKYENSLKKMEEKQRAMAEIRNKLRNSEVQEIDFDTTIKMLAEGLQAMGQLQEKWRKMVQFFQMISNIINTCLKTSLEGFTKTAGNSKLKFGSSLYLQDMIYRQAFEASNIANLVNMISGTYTEISSKYLMDRINSLGRIMALDPKDPNFKAERVALAESCDKAAEEIRACVLKNKELYEKNRKARLEQIENGLKSVLPPASEKETKDVQKIVASGFQRNPVDVDQFS
ncbi:hypothetical protein DPEC_G00098470 [Dallia pectoralis]|uniref:Uncharacterized protein n=1 Tax=Dallia pectoralis TaxID=75939 RepID=A0ACC2GWL1_DALPE|nr:hypothetical protein DPEC_G00098470 [Dallia pectoralis]